MAKKEMVEFDEAIHGEDLAKFIKEASDHKLKISGYNELIKLALMVRCLIVY